MKYIFLIWAEHDAGGGNQADFNVWAQFNRDAKDAGVLVTGDALEPASKAAILVQPKIKEPVAGSEIAKGMFSPSTAQIEAFYILECKTEDEALEWAQQLPTYGTVEVRPFMQYK